MTTIAFDLFASLIITPGVRAPLQMTSGGNAKINTIRTKKKKFKMDRFQIGPRPKTSYEYAPPRSPEQNQ